VKRKFRHLCLSIASGGLAWLIAASYSQIFEKPTLCFR